MKLSINNVYKRYRKATGSLRLLPNFIIIGAQRCGTTSLYNYLIKHPNVLPCVKKELHFFDLKFQKGLNWYSSHFRLSWHKSFKEKVFKRPLITGESSPYYIFHPLVSERISQTLPNVKLIALLRNPADRAYSHYNHEVRKKREALPFKDAIKKEAERLKGQTEKILNDVNYYSYNHHRFSYVARGIYVDQLKQWMRYFSKEQLLIIKSEDFYNEPEVTLKKICHFLNIPFWKSNRLKKYNVGQYSDMESDIRKELVDFFRPHNRKLYDLIGVNFNWD